MSKYLNCFCLLYTSCLALLAYVEDSNEFESEAVITVNLPGVERGAGCQMCIRDRAEKRE